MTEATQSVRLVGSPFVFQLAANTQSMSGIISDDHGFVTKVCDGFVRKF